MKKNECTCTSTSAQDCRTCNGRTEDPSEKIDPNLYAAEFFLYAFYFDNESDKIRQTTTASNTLRMLVSEG
jgi:hypothetical protein